MRICLFFLILAWLISPAVAYPEVIRVPADQPTIQAGIDAAVAGDTVLVADGTYTGAGNRDMDFGGKGITVRSENGAERCIINCQGAGRAPHRAFEFENYEGPDSVVEGFTITNGYASYSGGAILCWSSSAPTIRDNIFTNNSADGSTYDGGGAICLRVNADAQVTGNVFTGNSARTHGGALFVYTCDPVIAGNSFTDNHGTGDESTGGALHLYNAMPGTLVVNNFFADNSAEWYGGAVACHSSGWPVLVNNTMTRNSAAMGGAVACRFEVEPVLLNNILWENTAPAGPELSIEFGAQVVIDHSVVEGGLDMVHILGSDIDWGKHMIDSDPLFIDGPAGEFYLAQAAAGQPVDSPCLDTGSEASSNICYPFDGSTICLDQLTTRTDQIPDAGIVDMGCHYCFTEIFLPVSAELSCAPASGLVPFEVRLRVLLSNHHAEYTRRLAGRIDLCLASGSLHYFWRDRVIDLQPGCSEFYSWSVTFPARPAVLGENVFLLFAEDVTPPPFNQPPYPPSGDTDMDACTITGEVPAQDQ